jgi:HD-GYP domain-containing protein (c-di-GMP phosphodiesterase class II)
VSEPGLRSLLWRLLDRRRGAGEGSRPVRVEEFGKRERDLEEALAAASEAYDQTLAALVAALDQRERETAGHSQRVAAYAVRLGAGVGIDGPALEDLYRGALLHDIGKIGIPDAVLLKAGELDEAEWRVMREHAQLGADLLARISFLHGAADVPLAHHEAWDGSGYPRGLKGAKIPLAARVFAVVDSYDAIRSERPYKPAETHTRALELLGGEAGRRLDPDLVEAFAAESPAVWERLAARVRPGWTFCDALEACGRADEP